MKKLTILALAVLAWQAGRSSAQEPIKAPAKEAAPAMTVAPQVSCGDDCEKPACGRGGCRGGVAVYYLMPHWDNNPAFRTNVEEVQGGGNTTETDFGWDYRGAPAVWIGAVNDCGFGGRIRGFYFDHGAESVGADIPVDPIVTANGIPVPQGQIGLVFTNVRTAAPLGLNIDFPRNDEDFASLGGTLDVTSDLDLHVIDFEAMQEINSGRWMMLITGGIRYAHSSQDYKAFLSGTEINLNNGNQIGVEAILISGHNFNGAGPTVSVAVRRFLGDRNLAVFAEARGALLFGHGIQQADLLITRTNFGNGNGNGEEGGEPTPQGNGGGTQINQDSASASWDKFVPVAELEVGVDWAREMGGSVVFVQLAAVGMNWFGMGNAANNEIIGYPGGNSDEISDNKSVLGLWGVKLAAGVGF